MKAVNQLIKEEAQRLFDYRDGMLFWRHAASGHAAGGRAITARKRPQSDHYKYFARIGGLEFDAKYLVWNWHNGICSGKIRFRDGDQSNLKIENLEIVASNDRPQSDHYKYCCPACQQRVPTPTVDIIVRACTLTPIQETILRTVWAGKGMPVQTERIFDAMFADDPDGGPTPTKMYLAFKVALSRMRAKLKGTGVSIENSGYRRGYRLVLGEK